ncbi:unnamed protein product (macronuclear) [Paramecium tetraurelia]|uniref:Uncharacterized protein n=1 Tax=Paramecium tetraurelia TaxID=5888 RepID=A0DKJ8_PARTE|nr:uncharacterized protein GSPATT00017895001 [Paramecium tetraurelia]CAK83565.1 unnamed protein product [Paramecium tetraurelia]|eukprot:XP_001450962.1 hypothetical protein (macronuclear) [Paramecium tetraurelia strain d4-2]
MRSTYSPIISSPCKFDIPITKCTEIQQRLDYQTWSDVKKGIRDKVQSRVQGFENQKFIQKSDLLYNFKNSDQKLSSQALALRSSTSYVKNHLENKFPKQESPIKMGLTHAIYSPSQKPSIPVDEIKRSNIYPSAFGTLTEKDNCKTKSSKRDLIGSFQSSFDVINFSRKNKPITDRVSLTEIIKISNHLSDLQQTDITSLNNGYISELVGLQQNISKLLNHANSKLNK